MANGADDMRLPVVVIKSITHGLAVESQAFVLWTIKFIPAAKRPIQMFGINPNEEIPNHILARDQPAVVAVTTAEPLPGLVAEALCPVRDGLVAARATQDRAGGNGQDGRQAMAAALSATRVRNIGKEVG